MAKMIRELPADENFNTGYENHNLIYQRVDNDETHRVPLGAIISAILQNNIAVDGNITKTISENVLTLTVAGGSGDDAQTWHITNTQPASADEGDLWLHTDNSHFGDIDEYTDVSGTLTWVYLTNMKGADGIDGADGITPHINSTNKHWMIGETDTNVVAEGQNGTNGTDGTDGVTPHIDSTSKHWMIGETDTGIVAEGQNGQDGAGTTTVGTTTTGAAGTQASVVNSGTPQNAVLDFTIPRGADGADGTDGDDGYSISATVEAITGGNRVTIQSTDPSTSDQTFDVMDGSDGSNGDDGASISATVTTITGGHRVTISSTDTQVHDQSFDVMDGTNTIQTTSANYTATLTTASWSSTVPYTQTVTVQGMTSSVIPIIGLIPSATVETGIEEQKQWAYVTKATSGTDSITFSCYEIKPTVALTVNIKAV